MLISHSHKFIFIHTYKVAGSSIRQALHPYACIDFIHAPISQKIKLVLGSIPRIYSQDFPGHIKASELQNQIDSAVFKSYFKFGFVRNPWDWQVSLYNFGLKNTNHHQHELFKSFGNFENYLNWRIEKEFRNQKDFLFDSEGNQLVDYIGKIETLQADFDNILDQIKIPRILLPHVNISNTKSYQDFYTESTKQLVAESFKEDINLFKYTF